MTDVVVKRVVRHSLCCHVPSLLCLVQVSNNKRGKYGRALKCRQARKLGSAVNQIKFCLNSAQQQQQQQRTEQNAAGRVNYSSNILIDICRSLSLASTVLCVYALCVDH